MFFSTKIVKEKNRMQAICRICVHKEIYSNSGNNNRTVLLSHLQSETHRSNFDNFVAEPWRYPDFLSAPLSYEQYLKKMDDVTISEGIILYTFLIKF